MFYRTSSPSGPLPKKREKKREKEREREREKKREKERVRKRERSQLFPRARALPKGPERPISIFR